MDTINHLQFTERRVKFYDEDLMILNALPLDIKVEFKAYLKAEHRYVNTSDSHANSILPKTRLFEQDLETLYQLGEQARIDFLKKMVTEKRYTIIDEGEKYDTPIFPSPVVKGGFFFHNPHKDLEIELWRKEFGSVCVTLLMDRFIERNMKDGGFIYLVPGSHYIGLDTVEQQSSGFRLVNSGPSASGEFARFKVSPDDIKDNLIVQNNQYIGFYWAKDSSLFDGDAGEHTVPTKIFRNKYILNFAVSGEFELNIYFQPKGKTIRYLASKSFCCK